MLSEALRTPAGRADFAAGVAALGGMACFIGATAGVRHALDTGAVCDADLNALRGLLPQCEISILTPLEEAHYELASLRKHMPEPAGMLSMGGKSMQIGRASGELHSLPFAMHVGHAMLRPHRGAAPWRERVAAAAAAYDARCAESWARPPLDESVVAGVTDTVAVALQMGFANQPVAVESFVAALEACEAEMSARDEAGLRSPEDYIFTARVLLLRRVLGRVFPPQCRLVFSDRFSVSWTEGYFEAGAPPGTGSCSS